MSSFQELPMSNADVVPRYHSTVIRFAPGKLRPLPVSIHVSGARARPNPARLLEGSSIVGAGEDSDVIIESDSVSRRHAEVRLVPEGVAVTDLGSKNGCYYLGQRFHSMIFHVGSRFRVGSVELTLEIDRTSLAAQEDDCETQRYGELSGVSSIMRRLFAELRRLEGSKVNLLIRGESGTGKELIARAVHDHSPASAGPLVVVNCGALDPHLARSELFGHERGAFTGAVRRHAGAFRAANGGTLFLDEIGELPRDVQPMLLRALELRRITPVGSTEEHAIDVRLIAATHRDLGELVAAGQFREDLLYRIRVVELEVPPLRQRREDIAVIAAELARRQGLLELPSDFVEALGRHDWPGNVRELRNAVEAYSALGVVPRPSSPPESRGFDGALSEFIDPKLPYADQKDELVRRFTRAYLEQLMRSTDGNQSEAARLSGLQRSYLGKLLEKLGLRRTRT
jgi:DNA-binding NtrC family response regulator